MRLPSLGLAPTATAAFAVALIASLFVTAARAGSPNDRRFVSARQGVTVEAPTGWTLSTHTGFPSVLVLLLHPDGSRISIATSETQARDARELAEPNRHALEQQTGSPIKARAGARNGVELDGQVAGRAEEIVQLYLVRPLAPEGPRQAIVVSLVAPREALAVRRADLDFVIAKLGLTPITLPAPAAPKTGSTGERSAEKERR